jgi:hypothetical protein
VIVISILLLGKKKNRVLTGPIAFTGYTAENNSITKLMYSTKKDSI